MLQKIKLVLKVLGFGVLVVGSCISMFLLGYYSFKFLNISTTKDPMPATLPEPIVVNQVVGTPKSYYEDHIYIAIDTEPKSYVVVTASRMPNQKNFDLETRISYFNGVRWTRDILKEKVENPVLNTIKDMGMIKSWNIQDFPTGMLQEKISAQFNWGLNKLQITTDTLENEIGVKSKPSYTKFMSVGKGTVALNDKKYSANVVSSRTYSMNIDELQFYDQPLGVTTYWMILWTQNGNFYHVDQSQVDNPTPLYGTHKIGVLKTSNGGVFKTFATTASRKRQDNIDMFALNLNEPLNVGINLTGTDRLNKLSKNTKEWFLEAVTGNVTDKDGNSSDGFGLVEYLTEN